MTVSLVLITIFSLQLYQPTVQELYPPKDMLLYSKDMIGNTMDTHLSSQDQHTGKNPSKVANIYLFFQKY